MKSGILYKSGNKQSSGEVSIAAIVAKLKTIAWSLRWVGTGLMLVALGGLVVVFGPLLKAEIDYTFAQPVEVSVAVPMGPVWVDAPTWEVPNQDYSVYIPKIKAISQVIADVDPADEQVYLEALKLGVAEAKGLAHPGQVGTTYLFAHSTNGSWNMARYNAVFYLLDKTEIGDDVEVVYKHQLLRYKITAKKILPATDIQYLVPQHDQELLVLQTCYPPGTSWKRLVVLAEPVEAPTR
jgi:LPXTG-site transpeptidase (sortase) family protein